MPSVPLAAGRDSSSDLIAAIGNTPMLELRRLASSPAVRIWRDPACPACGEGSPWAEQSS